MGIFLQADIEHTAKFEAKTVISDRYDGHIIRNKNSNEQQKRPLQLRRNFLETPGCGNVRIWPRVNLCKSRGAGRGQAEYFWQPQKLFCAALGLLRLSVAQNNSLDRYNKTMGQGRYERDQKTPSEF